MNQQKQNILIVETKDGAKYQGIFISKDIQKQIITLSNAKKTFQGKEETLNLIEITKDSIASINILEVRPQKADIYNINEIPENKKNVVDESKLANMEKAYDKTKDDFFDLLKLMSNPEVKKESRIYNKKNKDTFNLTEDADNKRVWRGRGKRGYGFNRGRGRGRGNYRGGYNNYQKNNHKINYDGYDINNKFNMNMNYPNYSNYPNYQGLNYYNNRGIGRNRGLGRGRGRGIRGAYKSNYFLESNQLNNLLLKLSQNKINNNFV